MNAGDSDGKYQSTKLFRENLQPQVSNTIESN